MSGFSGAALGSKLQSYHQFIGQHIEHVADEIGTTVALARGRLASTALRVGHDGIVYATKNAAQVEAELVARRSTLPPAPCFACGCRICSCRGALAA